MFLYVQLANGVIHLPPKLIQAPEETSYVFGSTGNELIWVFEAEESEDHPTVYNVTIDSNLLSDHTNKEWFDNVEIIVNIDGLGIGIHNVEITVADDGVPEFAPASKDSVNVTVLEDGMNSLTSSSTASSNIIDGDNSNKSDTTLLSITMISSFLFIIVVVKSHTKK